MKKIILSLAVAVSFTTVNAQDVLVDKLKNNKSDSSIKFVFKNVLELDKTPVKDQGSSGTCWSYSGNSFLESELLAAKKEMVDVSEIYTARCAYIERAKNYVRMHGNIGWGDGAELHDVLAIYEKYGAVPYEVYTGLNYGTTKNKFAEMQAVLEGMLKGVVANGNGKLTKNWLPAFIAVIDTYLGKAPEEFEYKGKKYTPLTFAKEYVGVNPSDYINFGSFGYAKYYQPTMLMVPDNWSLQQVVNVPMQDLISVIDNALKSGYTIGWATDVSEKYFSWKNGVAIVPEKDYEAMDDTEKKNIFNGPQKERAITQAIRDEAFENYTTQDDHGMHIVGIGKDQNGKEYYIVKNSWGDGNDYKGFLYVSKAFVQYKTVALVVNKAGVPANILNKIKENRPY